jgi:hypothetical protein
VVTRREATSVQPGKALSRRGSLYQRIYSLVHRKGHVCQAGIANLLSGWTSFRQACDSRPKSTSATHCDEHHRFPAEITGHGVCLYCWFCLRSHDVEELRFEPGITVTYEAIRTWCVTCWQSYAHHLRHQRPQAGDQWHLDDVFLTLNGTRHGLCKRLTRMGISSTSWCTAGGRRTRRSDFSGSCSKASCTSLGAL